MNTEKLLLPAYELQRLQEYAAASDKCNAIGEQMEAGDRQTRDQAREQWAGASAAAKEAEFRLAYAILLEARKQGLIPEAPDQQQVGA